VRSCTAERSASTCGAGPLRALLCLRSSTALPPHHTVPPGCCLFCLRFLHLACVWHAPRMRSRCVRAAQTVPHRWLHVYTAPAHSPIHAHLSHPRRDAVLCRRESRQPAGRRRGNGVYAGGIAITPIPWIYSVRKYVLVPIVVDVSGGAHAVPLMENGVRRGERRWSESVCAVPRISDVRVLLRRLTSQELRADCLMLRHCTGRKCQVT